MAKKAAFLGMFTALALVLGYLESLVPVVPMIPGIKLGLANIVTILVLYRLGWKEASVISLLRVGLSSVLFGNLSVFLYSITGAFLSLVTMILLKKTDKFSPVGVSAAGGVMHNTGQLLMAVLLIENQKILYYFPILAIAGVVSGVLIGLIGAFLHKRLPDF